jgi:hypothetical protein
MVFTSMLVVVATLPVLSVLFLCCRALSTGSRLLTLLKEGCKRTQSFCFSIYLSKYSQPAPGAQGLEP